MFWFPISVSCLTYVIFLGEHIDYCGYAVFPMALEQDLVFAVSVSNDNTYKMTNTNSQFMWGLYNSIFFSNSSFFDVHFQFVWYKLGNNLEIRLASTKQQKGHIPEVFCNNLTQNNTFISTEKDIYVQNVWSGSNGSLDIKRV